MEILVVFDSKGGHVYELAKEVAAGIEQVEGLTVRIRRVKETTPLEVIENNAEWAKFYDFKMAEIQEATLDDLVECDGIVLGSPTRFGVYTPSMGNYLESTGSLWAKGALVGKVGGAFSSTSTMHGGNEMTIFSLLKPLMHHGLIIVSMGYTDPGVNKTERGGTPYGPSSVTALPGDGPTDMEKSVCHTFGKRFAEVTKKLKG